MKKIIILVFILFVTFSLHAQSSAVREYIAKFSDIAMQEMLRSGVPASITLAQGILESQAGKSDLVQRSNNHFGIKCKSDWTGEKVYHDDDARGECFRSYTKAEESYKDHSDFLRTRPHYAFLFNLDPTDYEGWAKGLKKAGYATNPAYPQLLIKTIVEYNLQAFTLLALNKKNNNDDVVTVTDEKILIEETKIEPAQNIDTATKITAAVYKQEVGSATVKNTKADADKYPVGVFEINESKVVFATAGTSLLALARRHNIALQKLIEFNEFEPTADILEKSQLVYLQKKNKKGLKDIHIVSLNETLYEIAQREGIRLESLLEFNRIPKGMQPVAGEKIYLRSNSPMTPKLIGTTAAIK
jgi:LysM repeat protein